jgi:uncharacterized protein (DUF1778 family)
MKPAAANRNQTIRLLATRSQKALIDRAVAALGRNRSDFMLDAACREAETVLLDHHLALPTGEFERFTAILDKPPGSNPKLTRLLKTISPWDQ